jgi:hypothetical protein
MLPEFPSLLLLAPQVSEIMSTLVTLKAFSAEAPEETPVPAPPLSHEPFNETSCPTWAETSCPANGVALPFLLSSTYFPPSDCMQPRNFFSDFSVGAALLLLA